MIPLTQRFSSASCFTLTSQQRKCFVWYLSVKRCVAGLPSLITHHQVRQRYTKQTQEGGGGGRKCSFSQTDEWLRFQTQSLWSKLIGCNWPVKYFLMLWPCKIHCSCAWTGMLQSAAKSPLMTTFKCGFYSPSVLCFDFLSYVMKLFTCGAALLCLSSKTIGFCFDTANVSFSQSKIPTKIAACVFCKNAF